MKWLKENWGWLVVILGLVLILLSDQIGIRNHKREINALNDSIKWMEVEYQILEDSALDLRKSADNRKLDIIFYQDSLQSSSEQLINQKYRYEKALADFNRIPTDSLYRDLTRQLDSLSLQW
jgi:hypothetical protein